MNLKYFKMILVNCKIKDTEILDNFMAKAKEFGETQYVLPNSFIIDTQKDLKEIYIKLEQIVSNKGYFLLSEIERNKMLGILNSSTVNWINKKSSNFTSNITSK